MSLRADPLDLQPERPELLQVVVDGLLRARGLAEAINERDAKAKLLNAVVELARGSVRVLHRKRRQNPESAAALLPPAPRESHWRDAKAPAPAIRDCLNRRRVERQQHRLYAVRIHFPHAPLLDCQAVAPRARTSLRPARSQC